MYATLSPRIWCTCSAILPPSMHGRRFVWYRCRRLDTLEAHHGALSPASHVSTSCFLGPPAKRRTRSSLQTSPVASFSRIHCSTSRCPPPAATHAVVTSHGQPVLCSHSKTSRFPPLAACEQALCTHNRPRYPARVCCYPVAFGPLHEHSRRHRRRAPAPRPRQRGQILGPQPCQHLVLKDEVGQAAKHGAEHRRRGRKRVDLSRGRHRILLKGLSECRGGAYVGDSGCGASRGARSPLAWRLAGQPCSRTRSFGGRFLPRSWQRYFCEESAVVIEFGGRAWMGEGI